MVELDQIKQEILTYKAPLAEVKESLNLEDKSKKIEELEREMEAPGFWDDPDKANAKMKSLKNMKDTRDLVKSLETGIDDILTLVEMGNEEEDESLIPEAREELDNFVEKFEELRLSTLLSGEYDNSDAIVELNAGAGGTESCDWCGMLFRMYSKWADKKGLTLEVLDMLDGDEAGIKSVSFQVSGENAY
jgi:peptide chain release factor 2